MVGDYVGILGAVVLFAFFSIRIYWDGKTRKYDGSYMKTYARLEVSTAIFCFENHLRIHSR